MRRTHFVVATVAIVVALVVGACGIDSEGSARRTPDDDVPFGLLQTQPDAPDQATTGRSVTVFLVQQKRLTPVERKVPPDSGVRALVKALSGGPTEDEQAVGLSTSLPDRQVDGVSAARGLAVVDLRKSFADLPSQDQVVAIAQIVFTLTGQAGIGRVSFTLAGQPVEVPRGDSALTTDPLVREDFPELAPLP